MNPINSLNCLVMFLHIHLWQKIYDKKAVLKIKIQNKKTIGW